MIHAMLCGDTAVMFDVIVFIREKAERANDPNVEFVELDDYK